MIKKDEVLSFLKDYLEQCPVKDTALNGLQVEGKDHINKIVTGVSASMQLFIKAVELNADMLIVHHGMFWGTPEPIKGYFRERIQTLLNHKINLVAYHLPLDKHPIVGNNAQLLKLFDIKHTKPFGNYKGTDIGYKAELKNKIRMENTIELLEHRLGTKTINYCFGKEHINNIAIVSGGAPEMLYQAIEENIDLFITGETTEYVQELARDAKINVIVAGHYNTEKLGIMALGDLLRNRFDIKVEFVDIPNPS